MREPILILSGLLIIHVIRFSIRYYQKRKQAHRKMIIDMIHKKAEEWRAQGWNVTVEEYE